MPRAARTQQSIEQARQQSSINRSAAQARRRQREREERLQLHPQPPAEPVSHHSDGEPPLPPHLPSGMFHVSLSDSHR